MEITGENDASSRPTLLKGIKETSTAWHVFARRKQAGVPVIRLTHGKGKKKKQFSLLPVTVLCLKSSPEQI